MTDQSNPVAHSNTQPEIGTKSINDIFIGMGGWELPPFNKTLYPSKQEKGFRKLEYYSRFFDLVEVNATFYNSSLSPEQSSQWVKDVGANERFVFTVKLFRGFTHTFNATKNDALAIHRLLDPLREAKKFNGLLIQFPSTFTKSNSRLAYLVKLRTAFPEDRLFVDLRHRSWNEELFYKFCHENGFNFVNIDLPRLPGHIPINSFAWDGIAYFRMMGRNESAWNKPRSDDRYLYSYSEEELQDLVQRIKHLNAQTTYVVFHNDRQAFSLVNGRQVEHALCPSKHLNAPIKLLVAFPQLKTFCEPPTVNDELFSPTLEPEPSLIRRSKFHPDNSTANIPPLPSHIIKRKKNKNKRL
ncbi:MAG: DUF72 domain-containing protein [Bacteroidota bacterium]|jgi:uncharacterized protein YecE (DUF72 family)